MTAARREARQTKISRQLRRAGLFKALLFLGAVLLTGSLFLMSHWIVDRIRDSARNHLSLSVQYYRSLLQSESPELAYEAVQSINFPIILTDEEGNPKFWKNIGVEGDASDPETVAIVRRILENMKELDNEPVPIEVFPGNVDYFHYGDHALVAWLRVFTIASTVAVAIYIFIGYIGFRTIRKAEERSVWVGMARETAHQLGTPISSLMGWIEVLGDKGGDITPKMRQDVRRLEQIAIRFSKIGAREEMKPVDLTHVAAEAAAYMRTRVGSGVLIEVNMEEEGLEAPMQPELIGWVLENLIRNGVQAMEGEGRIEIALGREKRGVYADVQDHGKGINTRDFETIFRPGYTTKKRGWGLGLSLARRIVEETHKGRIYVKESRPGEGTTFRMVLYT